jgi:hypothetical protein
MAKYKEKENLLNHVNLRHRIQLFNSLRKLQDVLNLDILLKGSPILTVDENTEIFDAVHHFITGSRRFT